ncbi:MAG: phosphatidylserine decarboxylase family protein [Thermodesulfobacteriota bacterium]
MQVFDKFPLAASGWPYILSFGFLALVAAMLRLPWLAWPLGVITLWMIWFFRDPARFAAAGPGAVICPADGKVVAVQAVERPELPGGQALMISVFMNVFDVHVNRAPVSGKVVRLAHRPGGFVPADRAEARLANERQEALIQTEAGQLVLVVQVAGLVARRIECRLAPGQWVHRGQRFGMIRFGSRVDLYLPPASRALARPGDRVKAGVTALAELSQESEV